MLRPMNCLFSCELRIATNSVANIVRRVFKSAVYAFIVTGIFNGYAVAGSSGPTVVAYYYPWYVQGDWTRHEYPGTPLLGEYGTNAVQVARKHVEWAKYAHIDAFAVSWWGPDHLTDCHLQQGLLPALDSSPLRFAIIYESTGRLDHLDGKRDTAIDFSNQSTRDQFVLDIKYLNATYFQHPAYLKANGKPLLVLYLTRVFRNFTIDVLDTIERESGVDVYFVADEPYFGRQRDPLTARHGLINGRSVFDAYSPYNMFESPRAHDGEQADVYMDRVATDVYRKWSEKTVFFPMVMPSYQDFRGNKTISGSADGFRKQVRRALDTKHSDSLSDQPRMVFITSFNEWWEGTTIEPSEEYGETYLKVIREEVESSRRN
ncbi:glycoside hydrolase family 99-like domain-containing protein [Calycomorphotria hydatis]|uniref:Glycosyltransferase WbsX n=1 Tax=Calycomorphotria hydatis TaxID=2528027 RepID=A0A517T522_9PLAN|nr:glycoside hydrolase family 99-like domain-containing protein [Calycomorphotria hydatis]QDT63441.1 hypothetical protein V22_06620 [Calycomorphotria hydatis]